jgi:hypothetical protein
MPNHEPWTFFEEIGGHSSKKCVGQKIDAHNQDELMIGNGSGQRWSVAQNILLRSATSSQILNLDQCPPAAVTGTSGISSRLPPLRKSTRPSPKALRDSPVVLCLGADRVSVSGLVETSLGAGVFILHFHGPKPKHYLDFANNRGCGPFSRDVGGGEFVRLCREGLGNLCELQLEIPKAMLSEGAWDALTRLQSSACNILGRP